VTNVTPLASDKRQRDACEELRHRLITLMRLRRTPDIAGGCPAQRSDHLPRGVQFSRSQPFLGLGDQIYKVGKNNWQAS
jgi:hypothetical protein